MKKNLCYALMMLFVSMTVLTACGSDDDALPIETEVAGMYKGTLDIDLAGTNIGSNIPKNILITKASENKINLELKDFSFGGIGLGTIAIPNCDVKASGKTYTFTGAQTLTLQAPIGSCPVTVTSSLVDGIVTINLDITVSSLNQKVKVVYKGKRLSGTENGDAKIKDFAFTNPVVTEQPVINEAAGTITFKVDAAATADQLKALVPTITISDKAKLTPITGVAQDFSNGKVVTYTVVAENGTVKEYKVSIKGNQMKFSFEGWENVAMSDYANSYDKPQPVDLLATSAEGASMLKMFEITDLPIYKSIDKKGGTYAIKLVTMDTSKDASTFVPAITSGSLFTGKFSLQDAMTDKLNGTKFGVSYTKKPLYFNGWYKYTSGAKFIDGSNVEKIIEIPNKKDECAIQAVLYKVESDADVLTGHDINTSDKRVAVAALTDGTAKTDYTFFNIPFTYLNGKKYEAGAKYKIAIVCSSSKEGDTFKGAGGSTLILDELEIVGE